MSYTFYLGSLAASFVAIASAGICAVLPALCIYWLATKLGEQHKWVGLGAGILVGVFGGGYIWMATFARFMDWLVSLGYQLAT